MKQLPLLCSTPMVQAIGDNRKTQIRITRGLKSINEAPDAYEFTDAGYFFDPNALISDTQHTQHVKAPYQPGDVLWVREEHYMYGHWEPDNTRKRKTPRQAWKFVPDSTEVRYSDNPPESFRKGRHKEDPQTPAWHKRLARFMPKAADRYWLKVLDVYPERVQDITEQSAIAEGIRSTVRAVEPYDNVFMVPSCPNFYRNAKLAFKFLWSSINGEESWKRNDWVWVIKFEQIQKP